jgi:hypothetical protein
MKTIYEITNGYSVAGGTTETTWFACALRLANHYDTYMPLVNAEAYDVNVHNVRLWQESILRSSRELVLVQPDGNAYPEETIACAGRIDGPVCPKEKVATPVVAWVQHALRPATAAPMRICASHAMRSAAECSR